MTGVIAVASVALAALAYAFWSTRELLARVDQAANARVAQANAEGAAATWQATADTADRMRRAEVERANSLEEELAHVDQEHADRPDSLARSRVLSRWRNAAALASADAPAGGDDAGPVSSPEGADAQR